MACIIYKDGESIRVSPEHLKTHLDMGWRITPLEDKEPVIAAPQSSADPIPTQAKTKTNNKKGLTTEQIRSMAKKAGLANWDKAQLKTLRTRLGIKNE